MITFFQNLVLKYKELLRSRHYVLSLTGGWTLLILSFFISFKAALYTDQIPVLSVGDIILDNIPVYDLSLIYTWGAYIMITMVTVYAILIKPEILPFSAKTIAAFIIIRAFFISLTHIGAPENFFRLPGLEDQPGAWKFFFINDLFFSGHVGFPFLAALMYWENKFMRYFMLGMSILQAATVLFMHVHYSIDVFSAFFITYTIFVISDKIFRRLNKKFRVVVEKIEEVNIEVQELPKRAD